jgi:hypothetical protein
MKKQLRSLLACALALILVLLLGACSASKAASTADYAVEETSNALSYVQAGAAAETTAVETTAAAAETTAGSDAALSTGMADKTAAAQTTAADFTKKIIYSANLQIETTDFDAALRAVDKLVADRGGFVADSSVWGDPDYQPDGSVRVVNRNASYTLRVPAGQFEAALAQAGTIGNVLSTSRQAQNVTSQFTDNEARLDSLETQEKRLLAMVDKATDVDVLVTLEERLSDVRYQIEDLQRTLKNMQMDVDYSTISMSVREVAVYTPTAGVRRSFGQKIADAFSDGWHSFGRTMQNAAVFLVGALPVLLVLAVLAVVVILIVKASGRKNARKRKTPPPAEPK